MRYHHVKLVNYLDLYSNEYSANILDLPYFNSSDLIIIRCGFTHSRNHNMGHYAHLTNDIEFIKNQLIQRCICKFSIKSIRCKLRKTKFVGILGKIRTILLTGRRYDIAKDLIVYRTTIRIHNFSVNLIKCKQKIKKHLQTERVKTTFYSIICHENHISYQIVMATNNLFTTTNFNSSTCIHGNVELDYDICFTHIHAIFVYLRFYELLFFIHRYTSIFFFSNNVI